MTKPYGPGVGIPLSILLGLVIASMLPATVTAAECDLTGARLFAMDNDVEEMLLTDVDGDGNADLLLHENDFVTVALGDGMGGFEQGEQANFSGNRHGNLVEADFNGDGHKDLAACRTWLEIQLHDGVDGYVFEAFYTSIGRAVTMVAGEFNGDDDVDLVLVDDDEELIVLFGMGDGSFLEQPAVLLSNPITDSAASDLDGDGKLDLLLGVGGGSPEHSLLVLLGNGDGTFGPPSPFGGRDIRSFELQDLDGDGELDVAALTNDYGLMIFSGDGNGNFVPGQTISVGAYRLDVGDLNMDGAPDIVLSPSGNFEIILVLNDGAGNFTVDRSVTMCLGMGDVLITDWNGDGAADLTVGYSMNWGHYGGPVVLLNRGDGSFPEVSIYDGGSADHEVVVEDLDLDGIPDLALVDSSGPSYDALEIHRGLGDGSFVEHAVYEFDIYTIISIDSGDFNGDGLPDLTIVGDTVGIEVIVCFGTGDGYFDPPAEVPTSYRPEFVKAVSLNGDDAEDLVLVEMSEAIPFIEVYLGASTGVPQFHAQYPVGEDAKELHTGDFNGDGHQDVAVLTELDEADGAWAIYLGIGDGSLSGPTYVHHEQRMWNGVCADLDHDGILDLGGVSAHWLPRTFYLFSGNGDGTFTMNETFYLEFSADQIVAGDMDNDGRDDLVVVEDTDHVVAVVSREDGEFTRQFLVPIGPGPERAHLSDLDGDADLDVLVVAGGKVWVLENRLRVQSALAAGPGPGPANTSQVRLFSTEANGALLQQWTAYGGGGYGVNVAFGQLDGDNRAEVVTGAGPGPIYGPHVRGFSLGGAPIPGVSFLAYGTNKFGVLAACGDVDADGFDEIITGAGPGEVFGPHVRGWNWDGGGSVVAIHGISYFAYGTPKWGVNVSCGDIDGDGYDEIVTGAGPGAVYGPHIRGWNWDGGPTVSPIGGVSFLAYGTHKYGVNVACGDIDGDGIDEIVTGAGPGSVFGPHVRGWNWDGSGAAAAIPAVSYFAYDDLHWGVNVSCGDVDDDGIDEIVTGRGPGADYSAHVRGWNYDGGSLTMLSTIDFQAFGAGETTHGVRVAAARH